MSISKRATKSKSIIPEDAKCDRCGDEKVVWRWGQLWCICCDDAKLFGDDDDRDEHDDREGGGR